MDNKIKKELVDCVKSDVDKNIDNATAVAEDTGVKISVLNDDVRHLVKQASASNSDLSARINDIVQLFNLAINNIALPDFSDDEKFVIANSLCGSQINKTLICNLATEVRDFIGEDCLNIGGKKFDFTKSRDALIAKIQDLNFMQRVKLIYITMSDF